MGFGYFFCLLAVLVLCLVIPTLPIHERLMMLIFVLLFLIVLIAIIITDRCIIVYNENSIDETKRASPILILNPDPNDITIGHPCIDALENEQNGKLVNTSMN